MKRFWLYVLRWHYSRIIEIELDHLGESPEAFDLRHAFVAAHLEGLDAGLARAGIPRQQRKRYRRQLAG